MDKADCRTTSEFLRILLVQEVKWLSIHHPQSIAWHCKLGISDKSTFKVKVIKIMQLWEIFTKFTLEHSDFSFSLFPIRSPSSDVFLKKRKIQTDACETSNYRPQSSHFTFCWNMHVAIKSKSFLSRCQIRQEQAAFGQFFLNVITHKCRDQKICKAFFLKWH